MKKTISLIVISILVLALVGCTAGKSAEDKKTIVVGATPVPHSQILEKVKTILKKKGYVLKIKTFQDYIIPNTSLEEGDLDANFFQHIPYLENFNKNKGTHLAYTVKVHIEPMGVYSKKIKDLKDLKEGANVAIPNDPTNGSRALKVLEKAGLIKLNKKEIVNKLDIKENSKKIQITELEAAQLPRTLEDVDAAVINTNYAISAKLNPTKDALAIESKDSPYANVIAVKKGNENKPYIKALNEAIKSPEIKKFIEKEYNGRIIPLF